MCGLQPAHTVNLYIQTPARRYSRITADPETGEKVSLRNRRSVFLQPRALLRVWLRLTFSTTHDFFRIFMLQLPDPPSRMTAGVPNWVRGGLVWGS
jgi:hypothetical protein